MMQYILQQEIKLTLSMKAFIKNPSNLDATNSASALGADESAVVASIIIYLLLTQYGFNTLSLDYSSIVSIFLYF